jgi:hypothetical protein
MSLEITGRVFSLLDEQSGSSQRGEWKKREFVLETKETYPKKICISCWNERVDDLKNLNVGQDLKVSINIESREYQGKWYTDVRAWKIEADGGNTAKAPEEFVTETFTEDSDLSDDLPF